MMPLIRRFPFSRLVYAAFFAASLSVFAAEPARKSFDLPAGEAEHTLRQFSTQSGVQVIFPTQSVRGITTKAVKGEMTTLEAIDTLLAGTDLVAKRDAKTGTLTIIEQREKTGALTVARDPNGARAVAPNDRPEEPTLMSPFIVSTTGDSGYLAQNTLAGSRLNTKLSELAAPVTAFTEEFLEDVASTSVDDLVKFMVSTERVYSELGAGFESDDSASIRIRGLPGGNNSINYFQTTLRLDHFNTERIDYSRGANSILFGMGSPGGVINISTKRARLNDTSGSVSLRGSSNHGFRILMDYNQPIIHDKLSVRVAAVRDKKNTWRTSEWDHQDRIYLTSRYMITPKTTLDFEGEYGKVNKMTAFTYTVRDAYSIWANAGKNRYTSGAYTAALGIKNIGNNPTIVLDTDSRVVMDWNRKAETVSRTIEGVAVALSDFSVVPKNVVPFGTAFPQGTKYTRGSVFLAHSFTPRLNVEFAANASNVNRDVMTPAAGTNDLMGDPNVTLPGGAPNPNVGRTYFEGQPTRNVQNTHDKALRLSISYERDLGWFFGRHILAGLAEKDWQTFEKRQDHLAMVDNPYNTATPEGGPNAIRFRTYFDLTGPADKIAWNEWIPIPIKGLTEAVTGKKLGYDWINFSPAGGAFNRFELDSFMAVLQSHLIKDRLITAVGVRKDKQHAWYSPTMLRAPAFGSFLVGDYLITPGTDDFPTPATNKTISGVFRVTNWLNLTYNHAANSALPNRTAALPNENGGRAPVPEGKSQDVGFKIDLGKRAYLSAVYFESSAKNDFISGASALSGGAEGQFNVIWDALTAAKVALPGGGTNQDFQTRTNGYNLDSAAKGYEVELIANPTDNWRLFFNFSDSSVVQSNLGRDARDYFAKYKDFWMQGDNGRVLLDLSGKLAATPNNGTPTVVDTVSDAVAQIDTAFYNGYVLSDGNKPRGQMRYKSNIRSTYSFSEGRLRGFSFGGGVRAQSGRVTNYNLTTQQALYGDYNYLVDINLGYRGRFKAFDRSVRWSVQLNVNNLLDETDVLRLRESSTGELINYAVQAPREFVVTSKFDF